MKGNRYKKFRVKSAEALGDCSRLRQMRQGGTRQALKRETRQELSQAFSD